MSDDDVDYFEAASRVIELEAERDRYAVLLNQCEQNLDDCRARIAKLEGERDEMTRRAIDDGAHDAIDAAARMDEREAMLALLDGQPDALASDVAADIRAMEEEPLVSRYAARIAELEAENNRLDMLCEQESDRVATCYRRIAELEADRDRLKAVLVKITEEDGIFDHYGDWQDGIWAEMARAALADPIRARPAP